jgi:hypothetical protein
MERFMSLLGGPAALSSAFAAGSQPKDLTKNIWKALEDLSQDPQAYKDMMEELAADQGLKLPDGLIERATGEQCIRFLSQGMQNILHGTENVLTGGQQDDQQVVWFLPPGFPYEQHALVRHDMQPCVLTVYRSSLMQAKAFMCQGLFGLSIQTEPKWRHFDYVLRAVLQERTLVLARIYELLLLMLLSLVPQSTACQGMLTLEGADRLLSNPMQKLALLLVVRAILPTVHAMYQTCLFS